MSFCIWSKGYTASLELRKIYGRLPDPRAESYGYIRIVDEDEEEGALYPPEWFISIDLPRDVEEAIDSAAELEAARAR